MIQSKLLGSACFSLILIFTISGGNASADEFTTYSGSACNHGFQGSDSADKNVQYGSFGGISNQSTSKSLSISCPLPNKKDEHSTTWIWAQYSKSVNASKEAKLSCNLIERKVNGDFRQSAGDSDQPFDTGGWLSFHLDNIGQESILVMECRLPTHGSRIHAYVVRNFRSSLDGR